MEGGIFFLPSFVPFLSNPGLNRIYWSGTGEIGANFEETFTVAAAAAVAVAAAVDG